MTTPRHADDVRAELRAQARTTEAWELPPTRRRARRTTRWRGPAAVGLVAAAVVVAVVVVPSWLGGAGEPVVTTEPAPSAATATLEQVAWEPAGFACLAMSPECVVPGQVVVDDRVLERSVLGVGEPLDDDGVPSSYEQERTGGAESEVWLLVGTYGVDATTQPALRLEVDGLPTVEVPASDDFTLYAVPRDTTSPLRVRLESTRPQDGGQLVVAQLERPAQETRTDWEAVGEPCRSGTTPYCLGPERIRLPGSPATDLRTTGDSAVSDALSGVGEAEAGDQALSGEVARPAEGGWLLVGDLEAQDTASLVLRFGDDEPIYLEGERPVLVPLPADTPLRYAVRLNGDDGRPHQVFASFYEPAE